MFELAPAAAGAGIVAARLCLPRAAAFGEGDVPNLASAVRWTGSDPTGGGQGLANAGVQAVGMSRTRFFRPPALGHRLTRARLSLESIAAFQQTCRFQRLPRD